MHQETNNPNAKLVPCPECKAEVFDHVLEAMGGLCGVCCEDPEAMKRHGLEPLEETDLRPYNWHKNNTECSEWFERDRALVTLSDNRGNEIMRLTDGEVSEFIEDGFKTQRQSWHEALCEYATEMKLRAKYGKD